MLALPVGRVSQVSCYCPSPQKNLKGTLCVKCGKNLHGDHHVGDREVREFFDRLSSNTVLGFDSFRVHCEVRERWGREHFGYRYLSRPLGAEGREEAADGGIYSMLDTYAMYRTSYDADVAADLLAAASKFAEAHMLLERAQARRRGSP